MHPDLLFKARTMAEMACELAEWDAEPWPAPRQLPPPGPMDGFDPPDGAGDRYPRRPRPAAPAAMVRA